ncbi:MAG: putative Ig domain-containing protein [Bacillota bacterium]
MNRFLLYLSILLFGIVQVMNAQSLTVSLPDTNVAIGTKSLSLPLKVKNFNNIGAVSIKINYNPSIISYVGKANDAASGMMVSNDAVKGVISIGWFSQDGVNGINITDGKLLDLVFDYTKGTSMLSFNKAASEINAINGTQLGVNYIDGRVTNMAKLSLDNVKGTPGGQVIIPLRGFNLVNTGALSLKIGYNSSVVQFVGLQDDAVGFGNNVTASNGVLTLGWFSNNNVPFNMTNGVVAKLVFKYVDGATPLQFMTISGQTEINDINGLKMDVNLVNGSIDKDRQIAVPFVRGLVNGDVVFPITVKNMLVGSGSIKMNFDPAVMTFKEVKNTMAGGNATANAVNGVLTIGYYNAAPAAGEEKLFDLVFTYKGGTGSFNYLYAQSELTDVNGSPFTGYDVFNGGVSLDKLPVITPIPAQTVSEGQNLKFFVTAKDDDDETLTYTVKNLPAGATFVNQEFNWTPNYVQAGDYTVSFTVTDQVGGSASIDAAIKVTNTNRAPVFTKVMGDTVRVGESMTYTFKYEATDADTMDVLSFSLDTPPSFAKIDAKTGMLTLNPTYGNEGTYSIIAVVNDGTESVKSKMTVAVVSHVNRKPSFVTVLKDTTIAEKQSLTFTYKASDPDAKDSLRFSLVNAPKGAVIDAKSGVLTWIPDYATAGNYDMIVKVTDGLVYDSTKAKVTVSFTNRPPVITAGLSTFLTKKDTTLLVDQDRDAHTYKLMYQFKASDPDGKKLTYAILQGPAGATIDTTGYFYFRPAKTAVLGNYPTIITITDADKGVTRDSVMIRLSKYTDVKDEPGVPTVYSLDQNYPNPFNPTTKIKYSVPQESKVVLKIYNLIGQEVATLVNQVQPTGNYQYNFNAAGLPSGIYIYRLEAGNFVSVKKMTLLK